MIDEVKALRTQLATVLEESRELRHRVEEVERQRDAARDLRAAAESERDALRADMAALVKAFNVSRSVSEEALAAARRECDLWKQIAGDMYAPLEERGFKCDGSHVNVCGTFGLENCPMCMTAAALAAPAAGEEGKR